jgi:hypothetical protein
VFRAAVVGVGLSDVLWLALHLTGPVIPVSRDTDVVQAAPAGEPRRSAAWV